jgi:hypothetical protein
MNENINIGVTADKIFNSVNFVYSVGDEKFDNKYRIKTDLPFVIFNLLYSFNNFPNKWRELNYTIYFKRGGTYQ